MSLAALCFISKQGHCIGGGEDLGKASPGVSLYSQHKYWTPQCTGARQWQPPHPRLPGLFHPAGNKGSWEWGRGRGEISVSCSVGLNPKTKLEVASENCQLWAKDPATPPSQFKS